MRTPLLHERTFFLALFLAALAGCGSPAGGGTDGGGTPGDDAGGSGDDAGGPGDDTGVPGDDAGVPGDDAGGSGDDAGGTTSGLCPEYDPSDPSQVTLGRASSGPAVVDVDTTWTADHTYFVIGSLDIQGVSLTIEAGTHVCLDSGTGAPPTLDFRAGSTFVASGTASDPVVFAPATSASSWNSLTFSAMDTATLDHVRLIGGGAGGAGVLRVEEGFEAAFVARDVHVEDVLGLAISMRSFAGLDAGSSLYVDSQGSPGAAIEATLLAAATLHATNLVLAPSLPDATRRVLLVDGRVDTDVTLHADLGVPFVAGGDIEVQRPDASAPIPTFELEAGVSLLFVAGSSLLVGSSSGLDADGGNLVAVGTSSAPVTFGSAEASPAAGDWGGIEIYVEGFEPAVTRIDTVVISDAGGASNGGDILHCSALPTPVDGAIRIHASASLPFEGPSIDAAEIVRSAGDGLAFTCLSSRCLTTDYTGHLTGTDVAGQLLRDRNCP